MGYRVLPPPPRARRSRPDAPRRVAHQRARRAPPAHGERHRLRRLADRNHRARRARLRPPRAASPQPLRPRAYTRAHRRDGRGPLGDYSLTGREFNKAPKGRNGIAGGRAKTRSVGAPPPDTVRRTLKSPEGAK